MFDIKSDQANILLLSGSVLSHGVQFIQEAAKIEQTGHIIPDILTFEHSLIFIHEHIGSIDGIQHFLPGNMPVYTVGYSIIVGF